MTQNWIISVLGTTVIFLLLVLTLQFRDLSRQRIVKRISVENIIVLAFVYGMAIIGFALLYFWLNLAGFNPLAFSSSIPVNPKHYFIDTLYFSTTTIFTVGYGDIIPTGFGKAVAVVEMMMGYILPGAVVVKWVNLSSKKGC